MSKEKKMFSISEANDMMNAARDDEIRQAKEVVDNLKLQLAWAEELNTGNYKGRIDAEEKLNHLLQANTHLELTACRVELEEYKKGLARLQGSLSACEDVRQRQKIDGYEEALIDIARGFIDYDQTELCREGMMITANEVILKYHKPTMANE